MHRLLVILIVFGVLTVEASEDGAFIGTWTPYSKGYWEFGDLNVSSDKLSWGKCKEVPYSIFKRDGDGDYLELSPSRPCSLRRPASFLIMKLKSATELEVTICHERTELDKEPGQRMCSWGVLNRTQ
ncbi:hypothetical protein SVA_0770 [Sulfurifustis variabilis]|uniref:Uncharacterized protein n=1 Tax=Sulfurifustis variabilis TaxID=1675686 RepID=A0A1B4V1J5_9GAMM|nr:hypothetical protein SVA_0770 [Sulfurifustis variabilis]